MSKKKRLATTEEGQRIEEYANAICAHIVRLINTNGQSAVATGMSPNEASIGSLVGLLMAVCSVVDASEGKIPRSLARLRADTQQVIEEIIEVFVKPEPKPTPPHTSRDVQ